MMHVTSVADSNYGSCYFTDGKTDQINTFIIDNLSKDSVIH